MTDPEEREVNPDVEGVPPEVVGSPKEKPAQFHRLYISAEARKQDPEAPDWVALMKGLADLTPEELTLNGFLYQPGVIDGVAVLGIHKALNLDYLSTMSEDGKGVTDVANDPSAVRLRNSTAVAFKPGVSGFGICKGQRSSPGVSAVEEFLGLAMPLDKGAHWTANPVMSDSELGELERARGVHAFTARFATEHTLFSEDPSMEGPLAAGDRLARLIGHDVKVELKISLDGQADTSEARQHMRNFLRKDARQLARLGTRTTAKIWSADGELQEIILGAHTMSRSVRVPPNQGEGTPFSALMAALAAVVGDRDTRL